MQKFSNTSDLQSFIQNSKDDNKSIGFVPTMGALHQGHMMLVQKALDENDVVVCSIFVNPTQFNNAGDLEKYPRLLDADAIMLQNIGCNVLFCPSSKDIYPKGEVAEDFNFGHLEDLMEGKQRPGHFKGMATVVKWLLNTILPHRAYFGEKDYQQLLIIKALVKQEGIPTEVVGCPIVREIDGLAMSSRNLRLNPQQRHAAPSIFESLKELKIRANVKSFDRSILKCIERINAHPDLAVEYLTIVDSNSLKPIANWEETEHASAFIAVHAGDVRLIDNIQLY